MHIISAVLRIVYRACINVHVSSGGVAIYTYHSCTEVYRAEFTNAVDAKPPNLLEAEHLS